MALLLMFLFQMEPLFGDQDFLEEQHLLVSVIAKDGDNESYGETAIAPWDCWCGSFLINS